MLRHSPDPDSGLANFARLLVLSIQSGDSLSLVTDWWVAKCNPTSNATELSLVGSAHPTADQGFQPFAKVDFNLIQ
jgi:hypothetical protein